jgi:hypothetical protein
MGAIPKWMCVPYSAIEFFNRIVPGEMLSNSLFCIYLHCMTPDSYKWSLLLIGD